MRSTGPYSHAPRVYDVWDPRPRTRGGAPPRPRGAAVLEEHSQAKCTHKDSERPRIQRLEYRHCVALNCTELARNQLRLLSESRRTTMKMITTMNEQLQRRTAATTKLPSAEHTVESQQNVEVDV